MRKANRGAALVAILLVAACASVSRERLVYNTIEGATVAAQAAMRTVGVLYQAGKLDNANYDRAAGYYAKFQVAAQAASAALRAAVLINGAPPLDQANAALAVLLEHLSKMTGKTPRELVAE